MSNRFVTEIAGQKLYWNDDGLDPSKVFSCLGPHHQTDDLTLGEMKEHLSGEHASSEEFLFQLNHWVWFHRGWIK